MGKISSLEFLKRTEKKKSGKRFRGPRMDSGFTKFGDQMEKIDSQEESPIYYRSTMFG
jgi:hypothetical protein